MNIWKKYLVPSLALLVAACGGDTDGENGDVDEVTLPSTYSFESRFEPETSSVSYSGQVARQVLVTDLKNYIGGLGEEIDTGAFEATDTETVVGALDFYFRFDSESDGSTSIGLETTPEPAQGSYTDISSGKDLVGKIAGNDSVTDHQDWSTEFVGWDGASSPEALVELYFEAIAENAVARYNGNEETGPNGEALPVYVDAQGRDFQQLTQKFLLGAINFSQGADDYLDDDTDGKGLLSDNTESDDGAPFTALEHQWDEGFGYFGAARNYGDYTDEEIAGKGGRDGWANGYHDSDGNGAIDLNSEYNFGHSQNAAKRDLGAAEGAETDFTKEAWEGFRRGRAIITSADGALTEDELQQLRDARDQAVEAWEKAIAATVVHYINDTLQLMAADAADYDFIKHAKVWSEMKGFALSFQFNPNSPILSDFAQMHDLMGDAPALPGDENFDSYADDLRTARTLIGDAYGFDAANLGDDNGEGGW